MSSWPIVSALDSRTQMFPVLTDAQIARLRSIGKVRHVDAGEVLFQPGDINVPFFVLLSGRMEIVQPGFHGEQPITTHDRGEFTGEVSMISGQRCLVLGRVTESGEFLQLNSDELRSVIAQDAELSETLMRAFILRRLTLITKNFGNVILLGSRHSANTLHLREFLSRNGYPHTYIDLDTDKTSQELLDHFAVTVEEIPVVICNARNVLRNPTTQEVADCLGLNTGIDGAQVRDLIIVGAGPAGLAAAVYAASEGLDSLLVETEAPGGQAASSSKIENYLGFPTGVSGQELASRAIHQAQKFGAKMMVSRSVVKLDCERRPYKLVLDDGVQLSGRAVVIATGAQYNKPAIDNLKKFEGQGIYYGATYMESQLCEGEDVVVVGGGNSAGQAAVFLSQGARKVLHAGALRWIGGNHVALLDPPHRGKSSHRIAGPLRDHRSPRRQSPGARHVDQQNNRSENGEKYKARVYHDGRVAADGVAAGVSGAGRQRIRTDRTRSRWPQWRVEASSFPADA